MPERQFQAVIAAPVREYQFLPAQIAAKQSRHPQAFRAGLIQQRFAVYPRHLSPARFIQKGDDPRLHRAELVSPVVKNTLRENLPNAETLQSAARPDACRY